MVQYYDAQSKNNNKRSGRIYTDLDLFFGKKSSDSDINVVNEIFKQSSVLFVILFYLMPMRNHFIQRLHLV